MDSVKLSSKLTPEELSKVPDFAKLARKSALVTGGASGLGAAIVAALAEHGAYVTIVDIQRDLGEAYAAALKAKGYHVIYAQADVTSWTDQVNAFKAAIAHSPSGDRVDLVFASAGIAHGVFQNPDEPPISLEADPPEPSKATMDVNIVGTYFTAKLAQLYFDLPSEIPRGDKSLVLVASAVAYEGLQISAQYDLSKWAVRGLFRSIRLRLAQGGTRINLLCPWLMETPIVKRVEFFRKAGIMTVDVQFVASVALQCAADESICGRSILAGPNRAVDMRDDDEGAQGGTESNNFFLVEDVPAFAGARKTFLDMVGLQPFNASKPKQLSGE